MTNDRPNEYIITAGVLQDSVLGPLLCNVMYNGMLLFPVADEATLVSFADDLAIVIVAKFPEEVEVYATESAMAVKSWLEKTGLTRGQFSLQIAGKEIRSVCGLETM